MQQLIKKKLYQRDDSFLSKKSTAKNQKKLAKLVIKKEKKELSASNSIFKEFFLQKRDNCIFDEFFLHLKTQSKERIDTLLDNMEYLNYCDRASFFLTSSLLRDFETVQMLRHLNSIMTLSFKFSKSSQEFKYLLFFEKIS